MKVFIIIGFNHCHNGPFQVEGDHVVGVRYSEEEAKALAEASHREYDSVRYEEWSPKGLINTIHFI